VIALGVESPKFDADSLPPFAFTGKID